MGGGGGGGGELMRRIPRIKFPQRHPKASTASASASGSSQSQSQSQSQPHPHSQTSRMPNSDVPAAPSNMAEGGKATLQPKRTPVSDHEIEAIMEVASESETQTETEVA